MPDERTPHLNLPLPHADNLLGEDVLRLREALALVDGSAAQTAADLAAQRETSAAQQAALAGVQARAADLETWASAQQQAQAATAAALTAHEAAENPHHIPPATSDRLGMVRIGQGIDVDENGVISTTPVAAATTAAPGIVQLSSAVDSTSETLAATSKAVKIVYDNAVDAYNSAGSATNAASAAATEASEAKTIAQNAQQMANTSKSVELKGSRSTAGEWSITGLTIGMPLYILLGSTELGNTNYGWIFAMLHVVSGANNGDGGALYSIGIHSKYNWTPVMSTDAFIVIPLSTTVLIHIEHCFDGSTLRAYQ